MSLTGERPLLAESTNSANGYSRVAALLTLAPSGAIVVTMCALRSIQTVKHPWVYPALYFGFVFVLTTPFLMAGSYLPPLAAGLPASSLAVVCPTLAALIVTRCFEGREGQRGLIGSTRLPANKREWYWCALAVSLPIAVTLASAWWQGVSNENERLGLRPLPMLALTFPFVLGAWLEEFGWSGYATERLVPACGALRAALIIGAVWSIWHYVPLLQVNRPTVWIAWWTLGTVAVRLILVRIFLRGGRIVWAPTLFHASDSICWQAQQTLGVAFDPRVHGIAMTAMAVAMWALVPDRPLNDRIRGESSRHRE